MSEQLLQMTDTIQVPALSAVEVVEVQRTTELPQLRVMFLGRDHPTAEDVVEYYRKLTGRQVTRVYHYVTPTLRHVSWHISLESGGWHERTTANVQDE